MKFPHASQTDSPYLFSLETQLGSLAQAYTIAATRDRQFRVELRLSGCDCPPKHIAEIVEARGANPTIAVLSGKSVVERIWCTRPHELRETKFAMIVVILFVRCDVRHRLLRVDRVNSPAIPIARSIAGHFESFDRRKCAPVTRHS